MDNNFNKFGSQFNKHKFNKGIQRYIHKHIKKGFSEEVIKNTLNKSGYAVSHIEDHFKIFRKNKNKMKILILLIILVALFDIFIFNSKSTNLDNEFDKLVQEGRELCREGKYDGGIKKFDEALRIDESSPRVRGFKGWCYYLQQNYDEAIVWLRQSYEIRKYEKQSEINPDGLYPVELNILGTSYCKIGNYPEGIKFLEMAVDFRQYSPEFNQSLEECLAKI